MDVRAPVLAGYAHVVNHRLSLRTPVQVYPSLRSLPHRRDVKFRGDGEVVKQLFLLLCLK